MSRFSRDPSRDRSHDRSRGQNLVQRAVSAVSAVRPVAVEVHVPAGGGATVDGTQLPATPGEPVHTSVLNYLHRLTMTTGHPVQATVRDERIGFVVPIRVTLDGASAFTAEPLRVPEPPRPPQPLRVEHRASEIPTPDPRSPQPVPAGTPIPHDAVQEDAVPDGDVATFTLRALPEPGDEDLSLRVPGVRTAGLAELAAELAEPVQPTPARGFDAVAEAVLEPDPEPSADGSPALLAEPVSRINEAVRTGQIEAAAALAEQTMGSATQSLGAEHPEVLRLRELTAYIAYLAGDAPRAFHLSLELARVCLRQGDTQAAYGNILSATSAWRAVRDPARGLDLGRDLIDEWSGLSAEDGPAAEDPGELDSARSRMTRLTERAQGR